MSKLLIAVLFGLALNAMADVSERELKRARVIDCYSAEAVAPVVVTIAPVDTGDGFVNPEVIVEGNDPVQAETTCTFTDSYRMSGEISGTLLVWRDGEGPITKMLYTAIIRNGELTYSVGDLVVMRPLQQNGAFYEATSQLAFLENGTPLQYSVSFLRNEADIQWVGLPPQYDLVGEAEEDFYADGFVRANPDPATIFSVQREVDGAMLTFEFDYRVEQLE